MVKRYDIGVEYQASCPVAEAFEAEDGYYVLFTDHESLERERDGLREALVGISGYGTTGEDAVEMREITQATLKESQK